MHFPNCGLSLFKRYNRQLVVSILLLELFTSFFAMCQLVSKLCILKINCEKDRLYVNLTSLPNNVYYYKIALIFIRAHVFLHSTWIILVKLHVLFYVEFSMSETYIQFKCLNMSELPFFISFTEMLENICHVPGRRCSLRIKQEGK